MSRVFFEDVSIGQVLPPVVKGPMSVAHVMRWSAATENWHRIHYDYCFSTGHEGLPDVMVNGSWKQNVLMQVLNDWIGEDGWLWKMNFQFRAMNIPGETLSAWGTVVGKTECGPYGAVDLEIGLRNEAGLESTPGRATVVLPKRGGPPLPFPFDPTRCPGLPTDDLAGWAASKGLHVGAPADPA